MPAVWDSKESKLKQQEIFPSLHFPPSGCFRPTPSNTKILSLKGKKCLVGWELKIRKLLSWEKSFSNLRWITLFESAVGWFLIGFEQKYVLTLEKNGEKELNKYLVDCLNQTRPCQVCKTFNKIIKFSTGVFVLFQ